MNSNATELTAFIKMLKQSRKKLTREQFRVLKGQAVAGDIEGAAKGLRKLTERRCKQNA